MSRTIKVILAVVFIIIITFAAVSICQNTGERLRADITEQQLYTLSDGTKAILNKLIQPITMKLYYTKTAARKAPDRIQFFNNYYHYVESLLKRYVFASDGKIELQIIDPRPFTDQEADALRYRLQGIAMSEEESFYFGLVVQTQFGAIEVIPFFSPQRQEFVEYDISSLIDKSIRRQKRRVGILSSMPVMGQHSDYMAQMMSLQGQQPKRAWIIIEQLKERYEVTQIDTDTDSIEDIDLLLVIHPKDLPENTLFAIDQFVLKGGRTIVCIDPYCTEDRVTMQEMQMTRQMRKSNSNLEPLMNQWGLNMPENTFVGDRQLAPLGSAGPTQRPQKLISALYLSRQYQCFNQQNVMTSQLNEVRMRFAGVLNKVDTPDSNDVQLERTALITTTAGGNTISVENQIELMLPNPEKFMEKFFDGNIPLPLAYLVTGRFNSAFPEGVELKDESDPNTPPRKLTGISKAAEENLVVVFSDVDFITDSYAYQDFIFGKIVAGDNAALLLNVIDQLGGSSDLISIRSRGNFRRTFTVVDEIEAEAQRGTAEQKSRINAEIAGFQQELQKLVSSSGQGQEIIGSTIIERKKVLELNIHQAQKRLLELKRQELKQIERLGASCRNWNTLPGPILVLIMAVALALYRIIKRRYYVSRAIE
ncbi:GldG family protein [Planctomycetota bacterium]